MSLLPKIDVIASCGSEMPPMSLISALGAVQPMIGPLMKLIGARSGLVIRFLDPVEDELLALGAVDVVLAGVAEVVAQPGEGQRLLALEACALRR